MGGRVAVRVSLTLASDPAGIVDGVMSVQRCAYTPARVVVIDFRT